VERKRRCQPANAAARDYYYIIRHTGPDLHLDEFHYPFG
jgi:hypothetical protein